MYYVCTQLYSYAHVCPAVACPCVCLAGPALTHPVLHSSTHLLPPPSLNHPTKSNFFDSFAFDAQRGEWVATEAASASHRLVCMKSHHTDEACGSLWLWLCCTGFFFVVLLQ